MDRQVAAFRKLKGGTELKAFESLFFNHMVPVLDHYFTRRLRGQEGNPLNEVRMLANSIMENDGVGGAAIAAIGYKPENAVLGLPLGTKIALDAQAFETIY